MKRICIVLAALAASIAPASAQVKILYGFIAGSTGDLLSRIVAERLGPALGQSVIVENRPGASGKIALKALMASPPDGTTLYIGPSGPMTILPLHDSNAGYDTLRDFAPLTQLVTFEFGLVAGKGVPAKTLAELNAWARANPGKAAYGTSGAGTSMHFLGLKLASATGVDYRPVHYRGSSQSVTDLVSGQLPLVILPVADTIEHHRSGAVRLIATSDRERSIFAPEVATFREQGVDVETPGWYAAYAPAKTPPEIVAKLGKIMADIVQSPEVKQRLFSMGFKATGTTPEAFAAAQAREIEFWRPIVKASGFKPEE